MEINVAVSMFVTLSETEKCNPTVLKQVREYLEENKIGYSLYDNNNLACKCKVNQIQIFFPAGYSHNDMMDLAYKLSWLNHYYVEETPEELDNPFGETITPEEIQQYEPKIMANQKQAVIDFKSRNTQTTPIEFFQNVTD